MAFLKYSKHKFATGAPPTGLLLSDKMFSPSALFFDDAPLPSGDDLDHFAYEKEDLSRP